MKINQLSKHSEVSSKTIRYYEEIGLMPTPGRDPNGYRRYEQGALDTLIFIRRCRNLQIPLQQIKLLMSVQTDKSASCQEIDEVIEHQLEQVRKTQYELTQLEEALAALAKCCDHGRVDNCEILRRLTTKTEG